MNDDNQKTEKSPLYLNEKIIFDELKPYQEYLTRQKLVEEALNSKSLQRIFYLIIEGNINKDRENKSYNDAIADAYYERFVNKKPSNPKVTSIYLKKLRKAHFIKRGEKDGRKVIYEVDWIGLFDVIKFHNIGHWDPNKFFSLSYMFYEPVMVKSKPKLEVKKWASYQPVEQIERISEEFAFKFLKPFFESHVNFGIKIQNLDPNEKFEILEELGNNDANIKKKQIGIYPLLQIFNNALDDQFFYAFEKEIDGLYENSKIDQTSSLLQLLLANYNKQDGYRLNKKFDFWDPENPKHVILTSFNNEIKILDQEINTGAE